MPGSAEHRAEDQAERTSSAVARARRARSSPRTSAPGTCRSHVVTFGICTTPPTVASTASVPIATFIGSARSAMWCSGPGKPTSVSSTSPLAGLVDLARGAGGRARARGLRARLAAERAEDHPPRVDRGHERADVADDVEDPVPAAALGLSTSRISSLEKNPENGGTPASARPPMTKQPNVNGIALRKPRMLVEVLVAAHRADQRAGGHEQQRLEEGVRHQVEHAGDVGARADAHDHVADLRHRRVGDDALEVGDDHADRRGDEQRDAADDRARRRPRRPPARTAGACGRSGRRRR